jgi:hypothetical protein
MQTENTEYESFKIKNSDKIAIGDEDDCIGYQLPTVDWENLEAKLKQAQEEVAMQVNLLFFKELRELRTKRTNEPNRVFNLSCSLRDSFIFFSNLKL